MRKTLSKESKKLVKDVSIGVITTVIGATLIYFLGFHDKKAPLTDLQREDIAVDAWRTYMTIENIYIDINASLLQEALQDKDFARISTEADAASQKFKTSLEDLTQTEGLDKSISAFLKDRLAMEKIQTGETKKFYEALSIADKDSLLQVRFTAFAQETTKRFTQTAPTIETLSGKLSEKYNQPFNINEFLVIQAAKYRKAIFNPRLEEEKDRNLPPGESKVIDKNSGNALDVGEPTKMSKQYLIAKWKTNNADITLKADGKMSWSIPTEKIEIKGNWLLDDAQLVMNIIKHPLTGKNAKWVFNISGIMTKSFTISTDTIPYKSYTLFRN